jgi:hypothetical protein
MKHTHGELSHLEWTPPRTGRGVLPFLQLDIGIACLVTQYYRLDDFPTGVALFSRSVVDIHFLATILKLPIAC